MLHCSGRIFHWPTVEVGVKPGEVLRGRRYPRPGRVPQGCYPPRGTGLRRLFAVGGDLSPRQAQGGGQVRCAEPAGDSGRRALHSPAGRDVISSQTHAGRPAALIESGGGMGPVKPRQPARLIVKPRGRCQLLRRRLRQMRRRTRATKLLSSVRARNKNGEGLLLSLNLRALFGDRIPLRTSQSRGWRTRGYTLWACRCSRTRPSSRTVRRSPKGYRSGRRVRSARITIPTMESIYVTDAVNTTVNKSLGLKEILVKIDPRTNAQHPCTRNICYIKRG